jgi:acyl carrier protein
MTLAVSSTFDSLLALIAQQHHLDVAALTLDSGLADAGLDSLAVAELIFSIEEAFKVDLGNVAAEALPATIGEVVALIDAHR